jgi:hypothetical protein
MTEILALHEEINGEDNDDAEGPDGAEEAHEKFCGGLELRVVLVDDADWLRLDGRLVSRDGRGGGSDGEVSTDVVDGGECFLERLFGWRVDRGYLLLNAKAIGGKVAGDIEELTDNDVSNPADESEGDDAGEGDGDDTGNAADFKPGNCRSQQKSQGEGEGEGDEKIAGKVEDKDRDGEHEKGSDPGKLGASSTGHTTSRSLKDGLPCSGSEYINAKGLTADARK